jgi:hypothetical protein
MKRFFCGSLTAILLMFSLGMRNVQVGLTSDQETKLAMLADQLVVGKNPYTTIPWVQFNGCVGIQTNFRCIQEHDSDNSAFSIDSTMPNPFYIEIGAASTGQDLTAMTVFVSEQNPNNRMVGMDVVAQGGRTNVPLRMNHVDFQSTLTPTASVPTITQIISTDGRFLVIQQDDGNFVVYLRSTMKPLWDAFSWNAANPGK